MFHVLACPVLQHTVEFLMVMRVSEVTEVEFGFIVQKCSVEVRKKVDEGVP